MPDDPKQPPPQEPQDGEAPEPAAPAFDPDYDLITDLERGTKHDISKKASTPRGRD